MQKSKANNTIKNGPCESRNSKTSTKSRVNREFIHKSICNGTHCKKKMRYRERGKRGACRDNAVSSLNSKQSDAFNAQNHPTDNNEFTIAISFQWCSLDTYLFERPFRTCLRLCFRNFLQISSSCISSHPISPLHIYRLYRFNRGGNHLQTIVTS